MDLLPVKPISKASLAALNGDESAFNRNRIIRNITSIVYMNVIKQAGAGKTSYTTESNVNSQFIATTDSNLQSALLAQLSIIFPDSSVQYTNVTDLSGNVTGKSITVDWV